MARGQVSQRSRAVTAVALCCCLAAGVAPAW